jgi:hypothetical protein
MFVERRFFRTSFAVVIAAFAAYSESAVNPSSPEFVKLIEEELAKK